MQRKRKTRTKKRSSEKISALEGVEPAADDLAYLDTLPEHMKLVEVTSNIWGTKFKIHGLAKSSLPANLGQVTYKTSLLHLQPRQMTLVITELRDDFPVGPDPSFNPNIFSEDEEEYNPKVSWRFCHVARLVTFFQSSHSTFRLLFLLSLLSLRAPSRSVEQKNYLIIQATWARAPRQLIRQSLPCHRDRIAFHQPVTRDGRRL